MKRFALLAWIAAIAFAPLSARTPDAVVAADGSGNYTSLQQAIDVAPMRTDPSTTPWLILVKPGQYHERIYVQRERGHIHILGEDTATTVVTCNLNATLPGPDGKPIGTFRTPTVQVDGDGMVWENITLANSAGPVGQALALRVDGDRVIFRRCRFLGWQDTIQLNRGRQYFEDCWIEGHVDFIFGAATAYFERCHIHCLRDGYITAASTPKGTAEGFVFADCTVTGAEGVKTYLGRPWRDFARTIFLRTQMSDVVRPEGWNNWKKPQAEATTVYAEFGSTGPGAAPAARVPWAKTLTAEDAATLTPSRVLAGEDGWNPMSDASVALSGAAAPVAQKEAGSSGMSPHRIRLVLVGDSTVNDRTGWGSGFKRFLTDDVECINTAQNGRSSKSFRAEGHWAPALALKGDYYLIQFGHNDQPGKGPARETDPATTYTAEITRYVDDVRSIGSHPILLTSLTRRDFSPASPGKLADTLEPYAEAVRKIAQAKNVPLIDLHARSMELCERLGPEKCRELNPRTPTGVDRTHLNAAGSLLFARLVIEDLRHVAPELAPYLLSDPHAD